MKLTILGGGGVRMPAFVRAVLGWGVTTEGTGTRPAFDHISLFEPDRWRQASMCRLATSIAAATGGEGTVSATSDIEEACTGADFVFSAIRVGGDRGRVADEQVALSHGLVGQETTGPGGCAKALRTIPVVLRYCEVIARCAPRAVVVNFTNPAGTITEAISRFAPVRAVGVCDTPSTTVQRLAEFLEVRQGFEYSYGGLNHLGWVTSLVVDGEERMGEVLARYEELQRFDHAFAAFDPLMVRRLGAVPTEYLFYYYDSRRYVRNVRSAGLSRGQQVQRFNEDLLGQVASALDDGDVQRAWSVYAAGLDLRRRSYMAYDTGFQVPEVAATGDGGGSEALRPGGYEALALSVAAGLAGSTPRRLIVNTRNGGSLSCLEPDDIVEAPALVGDGKVEAQRSGDLPAAAAGLVMGVKEYERLLVEAAFTADNALAAVALSLHPLVPGLTMARELLDEYRDAHGPDLAYLR